MLKSKLDHNKHQIQNKIEHFPRWRRIQLDEWEKHPDIVKETDAAKKDKLREAKEQELQQLDDDNKTKLAKMSIDDLSFDIIFQDIFDTASDGTKVVIDTQLQQRLHDRHRTFFI